jgi:hypothetical protein
MTQKQESLISTWTELFGLGFGGNTSNKGPQPLKLQLHAEFNCVHLLTRIEHWAPQSKFDGTQAGKPDLRLIYRNLMATCRGNEGEPEDQEHCDKRKGNQEITINPIDPSCEEKIYYGSGGELLAYDPAIQEEIGIDDNQKGILNLNSQTLRDNRFSALQAIYDLMKRQKSEAEWKKQFIQNNIDRANSTNKKGYYPEYVSFILYFLSKRLDRAKP